MAIEISVAEYAANPIYHKKNAPVPKPTVFKQIKENRLPPGVSAREIGGRYIITVLEKEEIFDLIGTDPKNGKEAVILSGEKKYVEDLAKKINKFYKFAPVKVQRHEPK